MIESWCKNELTLRRYRIFKSRKSAIVALWLLLGFFFISFTAEFWANSKPIVLYYRQHFYFPVLSYYHPSEFQLAGVKVDYRSLELQEGDWELWPLIPWDPYESNQQVEYPSPPSGSNWLGTDDRGRDLAARLLYGFRYSMVYAVSVFLLSYLIGVILGALMGYMGGWVDLIGQRVLEVWESIPVFMLLLILISIFEPNLLMLIVISSLFGWMGVSVYTRAEFLKLRNREFVDAGRALGASPWRLIFVHILPNAITPALTFAPFVIAGGIASLANLDYLGYGLQAPTPSWGELLNQAKREFTVAWWLALFTGMAMIATLTCLSLIGSAVRDAFDPRSSA